LRWRAHKLQLFAHQARYLSERPTRQKQEKNMPTGKNGNGLALLERFIPDGLSHAATAFVESLKINSISEERRRGRTVVIKRRNIYGERAPI
jgi:hypothetical protein